MALLTALIVLGIIWWALHSVRIVFAVAFGVVVGLCVTAAIGLLMVGALNLISIAFAVLFVGIGVDFGIQFSVRYRARALSTHRRFRQGAARRRVRAGRPLALAAAATTCGFYSFLPTDYRGVSELGLIAGTGMIIAFFSSITALPALLTVLQPPAEQEGVGFKFLAPVDDFLANHRYARHHRHAGVALAGTPLLAHLRFDFNPLNLRAKNTEAVSTLTDLMHSQDPDSEYDRHSGAESRRDGACRRQVAEAAAGRDDPDPQQSRADRSGSEAADHSACSEVLLPLFDPSRRIDPPTDADDIAAMNAAAAQFDATAKGLKGPGADAARHLADLMRQLANAPPKNAPRPARCCCRR